MRPIDTALLEDIAQGGSGPIMQALAPELASQLPPAGIDSPIRVAHFLGQSVYETGYLRRFVENLNYSAVRIVALWPVLKSRSVALAYQPESLANAIYGGRYGNGDEASGDGWRFRGRGLFQLTFRDNYAEFGYADDPDSVATPAIAVESAVKFWVAREINIAADEDDISKVTRLVTGGASGITERVMIKHRALRMLTA